RAALDEERQALDIYRKLFPGDNPDVARIMNRLGYWLTETADYEGADRNLSEALAMRRRLFGESHPEIASSLVHVAILQVATLHYADAAHSAQVAQDIFTKSGSATSWKTALAESVNGAALAGLADYPQAEKQLLQGYTRLRDDAGALPMYRTLARGDLEDLYRRWGRPQDAR